MSRTSYWTTAQQLRLTKRLLDLVLRNRMSTLEAFRKVALECETPCSIRSLTQLTMLSKGWQLAKLQVQAEIQEGSYFKARVSTLDTLTRMYPPSLTPQVEKHTREFVAGPRKSYILVVGVLAAQERFLRSPHYELKFWSKDSSFVCLKQLALSAAHVLVWASKISHDIDRQVSGMGNCRHVYGGLTSLKSHIHSLTEELV